MKSLKRIFLLTVAVLAAASQISFAEESKDLKSYIPEFHGAVRVRYEMDTENGMSRFQVRNARFNMTGKIFPSLEYYAQVDLCDRGKMKILDAWARVGIIEGLRLQAGQFRMPFGVDPFRAPGNYIFSNRSFIGKQVCNFRAVGFKGIYDIPGTPLAVEAGMFNPTPISEHDVWGKKFAYSGKATLKLGDFKLSTGLMSIIPDSVRANLIDGCIGWQSGRWTAEAEYMNKHYTNKAHKSCHAYSAFVSYRMPVKAGVFNYLSFQGRFDGMTAHSSAKRNADKLLQTDDPARNRITVGATLSAVRLKNIYVDLRANYEQYFYHNDFTPPTGDGNKALIEIVARF